MPIISVSHLSKTYRVHKKDAGLSGTLKALVSREYKTIPAVDDISFVIDSGEVVGFIGPNGAGKTTTLKCLSGLLYPTKGSIDVLGHEPFKRDYQFLRQISLVMGQKNQLWWDLPAQETFLLNKEIYEISEDRYKIVLDDLVSLLEVEDFLTVPVKTLSLGQRMKMELIASLLHTPKVLFLDEPTIGLDIVMQQKVREFLREYNKKYNASILLTSHYMGDVEELCKRVIIINFGKILYDGLLSDLVRRFAPEKKIRIIFHKYVDPKKLEKYGKFVSFAFPEWILTVSHEKTNLITAAILKDLPVADVFIEDPDIENIIREVFAREKKI